MCSLVCVLLENVFSWMGVSEENTCVLLVCVLRENVYKYYVCLPLERRPDWVACHNKIKKIKDKNKKTRYACHWSGDRTGWLVIVVELKTEIGKKERTPGKCTSSLGMCRIRA